MTKTASHIPTLPSALTPAKSSTTLINEHLDRLKSGGTLQKTVAHALGFGPNYLSMLRAGDDLPLPRVKAFAAAARLSKAETFELLTTRLIELHGAKGEFCFETLVSWADDLYAPSEDAGILQELWSDAVAPASDMVRLTDPEVATRVRLALAPVAQEVLREAADHASAP